MRSAFEGCLEIDFHHVPWWSVISGATFKLCHCVCVCIEAPCRMSAGCPVWVRFGCCRLRDWVGWVLRYTLINAPSLFAWYMQPGSLDWSVSFPCRRNAHLLHAERAARRRGQLPAPNDSDKPLWCLFLANYSRIGNDIEYVCAYLHMEENQQETTWFNEAAFVCCPLNSVSFRFCFSASLTHQPAGRFGQGVRLFTRGRYFGVWHKPSVTQKKRT